MNLCRLVTLNLKSKKTKQNTKIQLNNTHNVLSVYKQNTKIQLNNTHNVLSVYKQYTKVRLNNTHNVLSVYKQNTKVRLNNTHNVLSVYKQNTKVRLNNTHNVLSVYKQIVCLGIQKCLIKGGLKPNKIPFTTILMSEVPQTGFYISIILYVRKNKRTE